MPTSDHPDHRPPHTALMRALRLEPDATLGPKLIVAARVAAAMHRAQATDSARDPSASSAQPRWQTAPGQGRRGEAAA